MTPAPISVERLRELLDKATRAPFTAADEAVDIGRGMLMHYSVVRGSDGENIIRLGYCDPHVHLFAEAANALPALLQQLAESEADLEREQGVREDAQRQLRVALNDLHDMRWMYAQELKRAEAAERAREEAFGVLRDIAEYKGDPSAPAHNSVKKSAIARAFLAAVDTARAAAGEGER